LARSIGTSIAGVRGSCGTSFTVVYARRVSDLGWIEWLLQAPPSCLSELEQLVGRLDVDFAGDEGYGRVFRPDPRTVGRARVREDITFLSAGFYFDMHHETGRRPRDMRLRDLKLDLDVGHATLARMLEQRFGPGRAVAAGGRGLCRARGVVLPGRQHRRLGPPHLGA
jgi:hypothetical protein